MMARLASKTSFGILFRDDARGADFWANRNVVENNRTVDSGGADGIGVIQHTREILQPDFTGVCPTQRHTGRRLQDDAQGNRSGQGQPVAWKKPG